MTSVVGIMGSSQTPQYDSAVIFRGVSGARMMPGDASVLIAFVFPVWI